MDKITVRIRPIRFAFAVDPKDLTALMRVFEANSVFWGGPYNFILPLFKRVPQRYKDPYHYKKITASAVVEISNWAEVAVGKVESLQTDRNR